MRHLDGRVEVVAVPSVEAPEHGGDIVAPLPSSGDTGVAMSQETVEIARAAIERWLRDGATLNAVPVELIDDNVEWDFSAYPQIDGPIRGTGAAGLLVNLQEYFSAWESYRAEAAEFIDAGENVVVVLHETAGASGVLVERDLFLVWTLRNGVIGAWRIFEVREDALAAAGVRE